MAVAFVQSASGQVNPASSITITFASAVTSGNAVVTGWYQNQNGLSGTTPTDNGSPAATWTQVRNSVSGSQNAGTTVAANITGAPTTVTHTWAGSSFGAAIAHEVSGVATSSPVDAETGQIVSQPTGTDNTTSGSATTTTNGCYIAGFTFDVQGIGPGGISAGTGYTQRVNNNSVATIVSEDKVQASAGSVAATFTSTSSITQGTFMVALKEASVGGSSKIFRLTMLGVG